MRKWKVTFTLPNLGQHEVEFFADDFDQAASRVNVALSLTGYQAVECKVTKLEKV